MGYGDEIMASGLARGARARGHRVAFGDRQRIVWGPHSSVVFRGNPNIAEPGSEGARDLIWIEHYKGHRLYNRPGGRGWIWDDAFRPTPGEFFFDAAETEFGQFLRAAIGPFVLIEPNVPAHKGVAANKQWPVGRWQALADRLLATGRTVVQFDYLGARYRLGGVRVEPAPSFRHAAAALGRADLFIGHEGGMHHAAAAVGAPAVVIFGGFIPPRVTGYDTHVNLSAGGEACGSIAPCKHCASALAEITVDHVLAPTLEILNGTRPAAAAPGRIAEVHSDPVGLPDSVVP